MKNDNKCATSNNHEYTTSFGHDDFATQCEQESSNLIDLDATIFYGLFLIVLFTFAKVVDRIL